MYCYQCGRELDDSVCFCPDCGARQDKESKDSTAPKSSSQVPPKIQRNNNDSGKEASFQQTRFIISIVTLVFTFLILFQSCAVGLSNSLEGNFEIGGSAGIVLCICWWVAGILNISKRKDMRTARDAGIAYIIAGVIGLLLAGSFSDLKIYSIASFIFAVICYLASKGSTAR